MRRLASAASLLLAFAALGADAWPRFRGPNGEGHGPALDVPAKWGPKNVAWKVKLTGSGHSSPVAVGGRVFVTAAGADGKRFVVCLDAGSGKTLWQKSEAGKAHRMHSANSAATSTPTLDGERLYVYWVTPAESHVVAYTHAGEERWKSALGGFKGKHGGGVSPVAHGGLVLVHHQPDGDGKLVALDAGSGKPRWSLPRVGAKNATYSAPVIREGKDGDEAVITNWQLGITGVSLKTGKVAWTRSVFDTEDQQRCIPSPVLAGDLVLGVCGFAGGARRLVALRPGDASEVVWKAESGVGQMATPLVARGRVLLCNETGIVTWLDAKTGKEVWKKRLGGTFHSSPVLAGNRIYLAGTDGKMRVLAASDEYALLGEIALGEGTQATPALCGGRMFVRTETHVLCIAPSK